MTAVIKQLDNEKSLLRKRAAVCLASLAVVSSDILLNNLVELILSQIELAEKKSKSKNCTDARTLIQTVGTISRTVGFRLGRHLDRLVPLFLRFCGDPGYEVRGRDESYTELKNILVLYKYFICVLYCILFITIIVVM